MRFGLFRRAQANGSGPTVSATGAAAEAAGMPPRLVPARGIIAPGWRRFWWLLPLLSLLLLRWLLLPRFGVELPVWSPMVPVIEAPLLPQGPHAAAESGTP
jgi:hypothetical protein